MSTVVNNKDRVSQLVVLTDKLSDIIRMETVSLAQRRPSEISEYEGEKTRLAKIYNAELTRMKKDATATQNVPADIMQSLKAATARLREALHAETEILTGLKTVSERIVQQIAQEVARARAPATSYGHNAAFNKPLVKPAAFTLNRTA